MLANGELFSLPRLVGLAEELFEMRFGSDL